LTRLIDYTTACCYRPSRDGNMFCVLNCQNQLRLLNAEMLQQLIYKLQTFYFTVTSGDPHLYRRQIFTHCVTVALQIRQK